MRALLLTMTLGLVAGGVWLLNPTETESEALEGAAPQPVVEASADGRGAELEAEGAREQVEAEEPRPSAPKGLTGESGADAVPAAGLDDWSHAAVGWSARAVDSRGRPLAEVDLRLVLVASDEEQGQAQVTTDSAGVFGFSRLVQELAAEAWPPKVHVSRLVGGGQAWIAPLPMVTSGIRDLGDLVLREARETYAVPIAGGRVFGTDGGPVPGVRGQALEANRHSNAEWIEGQPAETVALHVGSAEWPVGERGQVLIGLDGRFVVHGPVGGLALWLSFEAPGYRAVNSWPVRLGALDLEIEMLQERRIRGRIRGRILVPEDGPPVDSYGVYAVDGESSMGIRLKPDGTFEMSAVETSQRIALRFPMLGPELGALALPPAVEGAADKELVVDFRNTVQLVKFQLLDESGRPLAGERLVIAPEGEGLPPPMLGEFYSVQADDEGRMNLAFPLAYVRVKLALSGGDSAAALDEAEVFELSRLMDSPMLPR